MNTTDYEILDEDQFYNNCRHEYKTPENASPGRLVFVQCAKCGEAAAGMIETSATDDA